MNIIPKNFYWGAATASHQVEGNTTNDWSEWEKTNAVRLAKEAESHFGHLPSWQLYKEEATDPDNYLSGSSTDHYHRYQEDIDIMAALGFNAYRFSLEWSRIEPQKGVFNQEELLHYKKVILALKEKNIEPFVTLWHWTLPLWLRDEGALCAKNFSFYFERYAGEVAKIFGDEVQFFITLNEPDVVTSHGYLLGKWPPQKKNIFSFLRATLHLISAHKKAFRILKKHRAEYQVGIAKHQVAFLVERHTLWNTLLKRVADFFWNDLWLLAIKKEQDFLGVNHYHPHLINGWYNQNKNKQVTDFGWEYLPESLTEALVQVKKYNLPVYITENGVADGEDTLRQDFIPRAINAVKEAVRQGVDVRGYLHWSLLDNFEWDKGYWLRFGLIGIEKGTKKRLIRPSARIYQNLLKENFSAPPKNETLVTTEIGKTSM